VSLRRRRRRVQPELELALLGRLLEPVLGDAELLLVLVVELDALAQAVGELGVRQLPEPLRGVAGDERAARRDELVGDLDEQRRQALRRVVVRRDAVDDAHRADQPRQHVHQRLLQTHRAAKRYAPAAIRRALRSFLDNRRPRKCTEVTGVVMKTRGVSESVARENTSCV